MKIKQQKQIKDFLIEEFGIDKGNKAMLKSDLANDEVYEHMQKYMIDIVAKQKHLSMQKMEDVDNITYGKLEKIGFSRTKTLGYGGDCCDFHFYKK